MENREKQLYDLFTGKFGSKPIIVQSPGRVNLIGEHTDYNDGFVLPAAIDKKIVLAMAPNNRKQIRLIAADLDQEEFETAISDSYQQSDLGWPNYILGVVDQLQKAGFTVGGFDCVFGGNIPIGAGLSSSAALEGGVVSGLAELFDIELSRMEMAKLGQRAENQFVGVQCGIMDQFANLHGKAGSVIRLDCRSMEYTHYPFERDDIAILLCDTNVRRELATSEYNIRRKQCEDGVEVLQKYDPAVKSLRDVTEDLLEKHKGELDPVVYNRCRYVVEENRRVLDACDYLLEGDVQSFGKKMYESHAGLRDLYEVSCRELDVLVEATEKIDEVLGSRMMGGGFGGCTINLVQESEVDNVISRIKNHYVKKVDSSPDFYIAKISEGVTVKI
jgi:galactokinase